MPKVSLVVCFHNEETFLRRLLHAAEGAFDDLVVVHDGPLESAELDPSSPPAVDFGVQSEELEDESRYYRRIKPDRPSSISESIERLGGRYYEAVRAFQQEPHWPFAWSKAKHDWILRLDADEFPSAGMLDWLKDFRARKEEISATVVGYTCAWPLWNGHRAVTRAWPRGRVFLFNRRHVRFFGMVEQNPEPDISFQEVPLVLEHQPARKSYGFANVLLRPQAYRWRRVIAESLCRSPLELPRWRWVERDWPEVWEQIRREPIKTAFRRLVEWPLYELRSQWRSERKLVPSAAFNSGIHHFLICWMAVWLRRGRHHSSHERVE